MPKDEIDEHRIIKYAYKRQVVFEKNFALLINKYILNA